MTPSALPNVLHLIRAPTKNIALQVLKNVRIIPNFTNQEQQDTLIKEIDRKWQGLPYQFDHWDGAIKNFRERELKEFRNENNHKIVEKIDFELKQFLGEENYTIGGTSQFGNDGFESVGNEKNVDSEMEILDSLHVLDLHESGRIEPHIDSVKFTGEGLASLSLVSGSRLRFTEYARQRDPVMCCARNRYIVDIKLEPGTLYIMKGEMRHKWTHQIDEMAGRRLSVMRRLKPEIDLAVNAGSVFNFGTVDT